MKAKSLVWTLTALLLTATYGAEAQQPGKAYRIGYISNAPGMRKNSEVELQEALHKLGYIQGQNTVIEWRFATGQVERLTELARELVSLKVDCLVAVGIAPTRAAMQATTTIPIVMGNADDDPVRQGLSGTGCDANTRAQGSAPLWKNCKYAKFI